MNLNSSYNDREKKRKATLVIQMTGNQTFISDPANTKDKKKFAFDYSYWSHDGFKEESNGYLSPKDAKYADQVKNYPFNEYKVILKEQPVDQHRLINLYNFHVLKNYKLCLCLTLAMLSLSVE